MQDESKRRLCRRAPAIQILRYGSVAVSDEGPNIQALHQNMKLWIRLCQSQYVVTDSSGVCSTSLFASHGDAKQALQSQRDFADNHSSRNVRR